MSKITICFEGIDGCGKSTQAKMLEKYLKENDVRIVPEQSGQK